MKRYFLRLLASLAIVLPLFVCSAVSIKAQNSINGVVYNENRRPAAEMYVELLDDLERYIKSVKTNSGGMYSFYPLRSGVYYVRVRTEGTNYFEQKERIQIGESNRTSSLTGASTGSDTKSINFFLQINPRASNGASLTTGTIFAQEIPKEAKESFDSATGKLNDKKTDEGLTDLKAAITIFPDYHDALERLGNVYLSQENYIDAEAIFHKLVEINPKNGNGYFSLGTAEYKLQKREEALISLSKCSEIVPTFVGSHLLMGIIYRDLKRSEAAEKSLLKANQLADSKEPDVHWNLALLYYYDFKRYKAAADELETYLKISPNAEKAKKDQVRGLIKSIRAMAKQQ
jgi:tetratricopeptide (TPR) repeat protein